MNIVELYNGEVEMKFDPYWHTYHISDSKTGMKDSKITSVTTGLKIIDKPQLMYWAVKMAIESMKEDIEPGASYDEIDLARIFEKARTAHGRKRNSAGDAGQLLHDWVEDYINKENPRIPVNEMLRNSCKKFLTWVHKNDVVFLKAEQPIYSRKFGFTGTLDFICLLNGELYIGDLKTSKGIYIEQKLQTVAYRYGREEEFPKEKYAGQLILRIGKDGSFEVKILSDKKYPGLYMKMFRAFVCFLKGAEMYKQLKEEMK